MAGAVGFGLFMGLRLRVRGCSLGHFGERMAVWIVVLGLDEVLFVVLRIGIKVLLGLVGVEWGYRIGSYGSWRIVGVCEVALTIDLEMLMVYRCIKDCIRLCLVYQTNWQNSVFRRAERHMYIYLHEKRSIVTTL